MESQVACTASTHSHQPGTALRDRRKGQREPASGEILLLLDDPNRIVIRGRLKDISEEGFQAVHSHAALRGGQEVCFQHCTGQGRARVMWTRVFNNSVCSGFLIL